jgi:hypothetical protein
MGSGQRRHHDVSLGPHVHRSGQRAVEEHGALTLHGAVEIDTNRVERSIRGWKLSLKNWLFLGLEDGGRWGAVMFSLIESCKIQGIIPKPT